MSLGPTGGDRMQDCFGAVVDRKRGAFLVLIPIGRGFAEADSIKSADCRYLSVPAHVVAKRLETTGRMWPINTRPRLDGVLCDV